MSARKVVRVDFAKGRPLPDRQRPRGIANDLLLREMERMRDALAGLVEEHGALVAELERRAAARGD